MFCCISCILLVFVIILAVFSLIVKYLRSIKHDLKGEAVFITGCDSGFGYHLARRLANKKLKVFAACLSESSDGAKQLVKDFPDDIVVIETDVTSQSSVQNAVSTIKKHVGDKGLWALVNNAGIFSMGEIELLPINVLEKIFRVNVFGPIICIQECLPLIRITRGRIINMCSLSSSMTAPSMGAYSATKAALLFINDTLVSELKKFNILSIRIRPYFFKTKIVDSQNIEQQVEQIWNQAPQHVRDDYGESMKQSFIKMAKIGEKLGYDDIGMVLDAIETALIAKYPKRDYLVPYLFPTFVSTLYNMPKCLSPITKLIRKGPKLAKPAFKAKSSARESNYLF